MSKTSDPTDLTFSPAVEHLYRSFAAVPFRPHMPRCAHCVSDADVAQLGDDVRSLAPDLVARFVTKSGTTWGEAADLRRVAPAALHLAADQQLPVNRCVVLHQLAAASWADWPPHEVDAVLRFLVAEWERLLLVPPRPGAFAHRWLRQTATVTDDIEPFLDAWQRGLSQPAGPAAVHLAVLLVNSELRPDFPATVADLFEPASVAVATVGSGAGTTFAGDAPSPGRAQRLATWLAEPSTEAHLVRAASDLAHTSDARRLTLAVDRLRRFRVAKNRAG